ncbi:imelysin family protein [Frigidibacter sp. MR17.24]|uniref:imelysin family protein n=1 Tax=Frigidibacter sp. MR17.24 TaxID=3127345 RepID=UPI003012E614
MTRLTALALAGTALTALPAAAQDTARPAVDAAAVMTTYADIAEAGFADALSTAQALQAAVAALVATPSEETLTAARAAWKAARVPYLQTETFRFANPIVDDWEGRVNAWPLDEGLIDYVDADSYGGASDENEFRALDVIANPQFDLAGETVDATEITPELIAGTLHEADEIEANVASGYHAIEFLLWGQDLHGTEAGAGERPFTDYAQGADCTGGNCDRRAAYLTAATALLVTDLQEMAGDWAEGGAARTEALADPAGAVRALKGMGSLSYGELAGERTKLGLMLNDPEEEQDCFSDNTHLSLYYDAKGIQNLWLGHYERPDGSVVEGVSLQALVADKDAAVAEQLTAEIAATMAAADTLSTAAAHGMAYDMMLAPGNAEGEALIMAVVDGLVTQTRGIERAVTALGAEAVEIEGSDSLDNPAVVQK